MLLNELGLWRMIDQRIRQMGFSAEDVCLTAYYVDINSSYQIIELDQDTVVLVNSELDLPYTAQVIIDAGNNKLETSKLGYEKLSYAGYQFFEERMTVATSNYGIDFTPYRLEFIRISPNKQIL